MLPFLAAGRGSKYRWDVVRLREAMSEGDENAGFLLESSAFQRPWHWVYFFLALFLFPSLLFFANMYEDDWGRAGAIAVLLMIHLGFIVISPFLLRREVTYGFVISLMISFLLAFFFLG